MTTTTTTITVRETNGRLLVQTPYHPQFVGRARALNGQYIGGTGWTFDPRDESRVRQILRDVYGTDDSDADTPTITIRLTITDTRVLDGRVFRAFGREIAYRRGRDDRVKLGPGVVVLEGGFPRSGGSMKHPALNPEDGTVLEIRDLPASWANTIGPNGETDLAHSASITAEIVGDAPALTDAEQAIVETLLALKPDRRALVMGAIA